MKFVPQRRTLTLAVCLCLLVLTSLTFAGRASAQGKEAQGPAAPSVEAVNNFRADYIAYLDSAAELTAAMGLKRSTALFAQAKEMFEALTTEQLQVALVRIPKTSFGGPTKRLRAAAEAIKSGTATAGARAGKNDNLISPQSAGLPTAPFSSLCGSTPPLSADDFFALQTALLVAKGVVSGASRGCDQVVVAAGFGGNPSLACLPFDIAVTAAEVALEDIRFCFDDIDGALIQGSYDRLGHIHGDIESSVSNDNANATSIIAADTASRTAIISNTNTNAASIISNDNANRTAIVNNDNANAAGINANANANTASLITNANANRTLIIANDNANTAAIIANDNANKNELRDLILRTQIESDLGEADSATPVGLYLTPNAQGGYLDLVQTIVTQTIARVQAAGGSVGQAPTFLAQANAAKAAGQFKSAYDLYRKAYKAAVK